MVTKPYVPILKWKNAERDALKDLPDSAKDRMLPLFEILQPLELSARATKAGFSTPEDELIGFLSIKTPQDILLCWGDEIPFYIDFSLIHTAELRLGFAKEFFANSKKLGLDPIPAINPGADDFGYIRNLVDLSRKNSDRICLRFTRGRVDDVPDSNILIERIVNECNISPELISIIVDLKEYTEADIYERAVSFSQSLKHLNRFHHLTVACGAFPKNMNEYKIDEFDNHKNREDWLNWNDKAYGAGLKRTPGYGDYTIRHPVYDEMAMRYLSSPTIKYTTDDRWIFIKGKVKKFNHYLVNAKLLTERKEYKKYGPGFSAGDKYIDEKRKFYEEHAKAIGNGDHVGGTGNAEQWIRAGINHHIAVVLDQLSNLDERE